MLSQRRVLVVLDNAAGLQDAMTGSRLVTLDARVHGVYGEYGNACVDDTVDTYLATGELPESDSTCQT